MRNIYAGLLLFLAQVYLTFKGVKHFSADWNPLVLFALSFAVGYLWLRILLKEKTATAQTDAPESGWRRKAAGALVGMFSMALCYEELRKLFVRFSPPGKFSDVLPQLEALYTRFTQGVFPYQPVDVGTHVAYPVYLPLHWLPIGISDMLNMDTRWSGYILLVVAAGIYGYLVFRQPRPLAAQIVATLLPSIALWGYILWGREDIPVSYELVIAAYYLVLAAGLRGHSTWWVTTGLILCLLSRYTLVFWVPLFAVLFWQNETLRRNAALWLSVAVSVLAIYVIPFLLKDPGVFLQGIAYHNNAAIAEWKGYGDPPVSWTLEQGIHFARHIRYLTGGDAERQVFVARVVQAVAMLLLLFAGLWGYRRWRDRIHFYDFSLLMLYFFILFFYNFGPLTYRYYLIVPLSLSAVICGRIVTATTSTTFSRTATTQTTRSNPAK
ncbi:MAG TPA: hypothetical protein PK228_04575 [Saprospiraceae bacterium]|nr:hypothetical protein [Saprospiraceae bacterium]